MSWGNGGYKKKMPTNSSLALQDLQSRHKRIAGLPHHELLLGCFLGLEFLLDLFYIDPLGHGLEALDLQ